VSFLFPTQNLIIALTSTSPIDVIFLLIFVSTSDVKTVVFQTIVMIYEYNFQEMTLTLNLTL
jgi:hypothetical protein